MIRTTILALSVILSATGTLRAQQAQFGVKAGLSASTYHGSDVPSPRFRLGPAAGLVAYLPLSTRLALQPELLYEQRGARTSYRTTYMGPSSTTLAYEYKERSRLHYASLPVLLRVQGEKWFAVAGPQVSYLLAEQRHTSRNIELVSGPADPILPAGRTVTTTQQVDDYRRWELGYAAGIGYQLMPRLGVEVRYAAALTKLRPKQEIDYPVLFEDAATAERLQQARNGAVQVQISYWFTAL